MNRPDEHYTPQQDERAWQEHDRHQIEESIRAALERCRDAGAKDDDLRLLCWQCDIPAEAVLRR